MLFEADELSKKSDGKLEFAFVGTGDGGGGGAFFNILFIFFGSCGTSKDDGLLLEVVGCGGADNFNFAFLANSILSLCNLEFKWTGQIASLRTTVLQITQVSWSNSLYVFTG